LAGVGEHSVGRANPLAARIMAENVGYELLVAAGDALTGTAILDAEGEPSNIDIAQFLNANKRAMERARNALRLKCVVPVEYDGAFLERHCTALPLLRDLARSFAMELKTAERLGDLRHAVAIGLEVFELANATRRGGLVCDLLVGIAIEGIAIRRMVGIRRSLKPDDAALLANRLLQIDKEREPFGDVCARDRKWEASVGCSPKDADFAHLRPPEEGAPGVDENLQLAITEFIKSFTVLPDEQKNAFYRQPEDRNVALIRLLALESALTCYHARNGTYPAGLPSLVPNCISSIPPDPFTEAEFIYRKTPAGFVVYSPGPTGRDLGGKFGSWLSVLSGSADLALDLFDYNDAC